jgi:TetR/AcrR family transcriptional regulator
MAGQITSEDAPRGAELTREKLLQATHELLCENSGAEPSVSQICQRAGVQVAMVSYCFGGKAGLFEALIDRTMTELRLHIAALIRNYVRFPYANQLSERLAAGDRVTTRIAGLLARPMLEFYSELLEQGRAAGEFRRIDPALFSFSLVGMCEFVFAAPNWLEHAIGKPVDDELIERFTDHTVALVMDGIAAR